VTDAAISACRPLPDRHFHILLALAEGDAHGWAVIKRIRELARHRAAPSSGSLYLAMLRLEEKGLIAECAGGEAGGDERRRCYTLTELGRSVLRAETARLSELVAVARRAEGAIALRSEAR